MTKKLKLFFDNFEKIADSPGGVKKLRELILQLAVQGKLVPQDPNDEPASELLKKIKAEKEKLIKEGKIKKQKPLPPIEPEEIPYKLPNGWEWEKLGEIGITQTGTTPSKNHPEYYGYDYPFVKPADIFGNHINYGNEGLSKLGLENGRLIKKGSTLMVCIGTVGKTGYIERDCSCNQQINSITPFAKINNKFMAYFMRSAYFQYECVNRASSTTLLILNKGKWESIAFPLPPLAEQKRIVAKVDELMALCDKLEEKQQNSDKKLVMLNDSAIDHLLEASTPAEFAKQWQLICNNFDLLYDDPENVKKLRQAILQLAIQGKLVPQDPNDEPASELLKKIKAEKEKLIEQGKIKKQKPLPPIEPDEIPYKLPNGWERCQLGEIVSLLGDGIHGTPNYDSTGKFYFINGNNLSDGKIVIKNNTKTVSFEEYSKHKKELNKNTILVSINGTIGNIAFYNDEKIILGKSACYFNLIEGVDKLYLKIPIRSNYFLGYAFSAATGTTIKNVSLKAMREFPFPLPPLAEQKRIVTKVDELMALCDELEEQIRQSKDKSEKLLSSTIHHILVA